MTTTQQVLALPLTAVALAAYDSRVAQEPPEDSKQKVWTDHYKELNKLGEEVGIAFGKDIGSKTTTCKSLVRPQPWLRGLVEDWKKSQYPDVQSQLLALPSGVINRVEIINLYGRLVVIKIMRTDKGLLDMLSGKHIEISNGRVLPAEN